MEPSLFPTVSVRSDQELLRGRGRNFPEIVRQLELGVASSVALGDFLDGFYRAVQIKRQSFIDHEPPISNAPQADDVFYTYCAALAEKLAHEYDLQTPAWVNKQKYVLRVPNYGGYREEQLSAKMIHLMRQESPPEFVRHNLFVSPNALVRY
jgi:hypothetical protein